MATLTFDVPDTLTEAEQEQMRRQIDALLDTWRSTHHAYRHSSEFAEGSETTEDREARTANTGEQPTSLPMVREEQFDRLANLIPASAPYLSNEALRRENLYD